MTGQEAVKRNEKAQGLRAWQVDDTWFYVESEDGKIAYKCCITDKGDFCNCGDFASRSKNDPNFKCKHILAVMNSIPRNEVMETQFMEKRKPKLDERFIKQVEGKDFVLYSGLLDLAHQKNLVSMDVELLQFPSKDNDHTAICKAIARTMTGGPFIDIGDANPMNCNSKVAKHIIRMSSTRAKARCLRDLTNIGITCLEELGDITDVIGAEDMEGRKSQPSRKDNVKKFTPKQTQAGNGNGGKPENENPKPDQGKVETAIQPDPPVLPPAEAPQEKTAVERADGKPEKVSRASAKTVKSGNGKDQIPMMSEAQKSAIYNLSRRRGISVEELENMAKTTFNMPVESLSHENAVSFIRTLQQAA